MSPAARFSAAATASSSVPSPSAASAAASAQNPSAIATMPVSTTRTGTGAFFAASTAASYVPENSADRCSETIPVAPVSAAVRYAAAKTSGLGRDVVTECRFWSARASERAEISVPSSSARSPSTTVSGTAVMLCRSIVCGGR